VNAGLAINLELGRYFRRHIAAQLYDDSGVSPQASAIYFLSDPRDIRQVRYVGQTSAPQRRFLQHLNAAMLWLPDDKPWWVKAPKLRPLSGWIRQLYRDEQRLPMMVVTAWAATTAQARIAERARIYECLERRLQLLNVETQILGRQIPLL
jgi:hypothetical protein